MLLGRATAILPSASHIAAARGTLPGWPQRFTAASNVEENLKAGLSSGDIENRLMQ